MTLKKKLIYFLIIFISFTGLSSCYDYVEVNSVYYAASMGIDYNDTNKMYTIYIYVINNLNLSQIDIAASEADKMAYVARATDTTLTRAFNTIYQNSDVMIDLHHLKTLILTESFFNEKNCLRLYQLIKNNYDFYLNFAIYTTEEELGDIYIVQNFTETSAYYTLLTKSNNFNNYVLPSFVDFANDTMNQFYTILYPVLKVSYLTFEKDEINYITLSLNGYSALTPDYKLMIFGENEFYGINFLNNLADMKLPLINDNKVYIFDIQRFQKKFKLKEDTFTISFYLRGSIILDETFKYNHQHAQELIKTEISYGITQIYEEAKNNKVDFFNINEFARIQNNHNTYETIKLKIEFKIIFI